MRTDWTAIGAQARADAARKAATMAELDGQPHRRGYAEWVEAQGAARRAAERVSRLAAEASRPVPGGLSTSEWIAQASRLRQARRDAAAEAERAASLTPASQRIAAFEASRRRDAEITRRMARASMTPAGRARLDAKAGPRRTSSAAGPARRPASAALANVLGKALTRG